jgi:hypothetical protein
VVEDAAHPNITSIGLCTALGKDGLRRMIGAAHSLALPAASTAPFPALLLGADEVGITASDERIAPIAPRGIGGNFGTNYSDVITIAGALNTILISNLASTDMARLSARSNLTDHPAYKNLFTADERSWYRDSWKQQVKSMPDDADVSLDSTGQILFRSIAQGARVATGSRAPLTPYGLGLQAELQLLDATGLRPFQILKMATLDAARILGAGDDLGSIHAGKLADLVIVDGDPLTDIADTANVVTTLVNGRPYAADELLRPGGRAGGVGKFYTPEGAN